MASTLSPSPGALVPAVFAATSVSSVAIANSGSKTFTTQTGLGYTVGSRVRCSDASAPTTNWMEGIVTSYTGSSLVFTADDKAGSGTLTDWTISLTGAKGATGATGATGPAWAPTRKHSSRTPQGEPRPMRRPARRSTRSSTS